MSINPNNIESNATFCEHDAQPRELPPCDTEVYEFGQAVAICETHGAIPFDEWIQIVRMFNGNKDKIDWHYVAGRAVVKVIGSPKRVKHAMEECRHSCPARIKFL